MKGGRPGEGRGGGAALPLSPVATGLSPASCPGNLASAVTPERHLIWNERLFYFLDT